MKKLILFLSISIIIISSIEMTVFLANVGELNQLESQQFKILKLSKLTEENPSNVDLEEEIANYKIGLQFYQQHNYLQAISELLKVNYTTLNLPLYVKSQFILGQCYKNNGELDKAIEVYQNLILDDPILTDYSLFFLAQAYYFKEDYRKSINILEQIIENFPNSSIIYKTQYQIAQNYLALKDTLLAVKYYQEILETTKDNQLKAEILLQLSEIFWQEKKYIDSLNYLYEILDKGYRLKRNSEPEELLVRRFYKIVENEKDIDVPDYLIIKCADTLFKYRQYKQAHSLYEEVIKTFPKAQDIEETYYKRARTLYYNKEYNQSIERCKEIILKFSQ